jgi:multiple sugar transport system substrate-binding protein
MKANDASMLQPAAPIRGWRGSRRDFLRGATIAAGAVLVGCGRTNVPGTRVTLTQWYHQYGEKGTQEAVVRYAKAYTALHPDIAIQVVWVPGDYGTKLATALLTRGGPDIFEGQITKPMVTAEQVAPLDDLFPRQCLRTSPRVTSPKIVWTAKSTA